MHIIERADQVFSDIFDPPIRLGKLSWRFGHLTNNDTLIFLACLARNGFTPVMEIGTYTGRTAYNLALNTPDKIHTVDIGKNIDAASNVEKADYPEYTPGEAFISDPEVNSRIELILGDSQKIDFSPFYGKIGMVIIDGGHSYEAVKSDTAQALRMIRPDGIIVWDDYSDYWPGVKQAVDEFPNQNGLVHFKHQSLVLYSPAIKLT